MLLLLLTAAPSGTVLITSWLSSLQPLVTSSSFHFSRCTLTVLLPQFTVAFLLYVFLLCHQVVWLPEGSFGGVTKHAAVCTSLIVQWEFDVEERCVSVQSCSLNSLQSAKSFPLAVLSKLIYYFPCCLQTSELLNAAEWSSAVRRSLQHLNAPPGHHFNSLFIYLLLL